MFHVRLRSGPLRLRQFTALNFDWPTVAQEVLEPWSRGTDVRLGGRSWSPHSCELEVYEGGYIAHTSGSARVRWQRVLSSGARDVTQAALTSQLANQQNHTITKTERTWTFADRLAILLAPLTAIFGVTGSRAAVACGVLAVALFAGPRAGRALSAAGTAARVWTGIGLAVACAALLAAAAWTDPGQTTWHWLKNEKDQPARGKTLDEIRAAARNAGMNIVAIRQVAFRPGQPRATLMILRSRSADERSDELRVYEAGASSTLIERRRFAPTADVTYRGPIGRKRPSGTSALQPLVFSMSVKFQGDLDGVAGDEVIVDLYEYGRQSVWPRPLYLHWDSDTRSYDLQALLSPSSTGLASMGPVIDRRHLRGIDFAGGAITVYTTPTVIRDRAGQVHDITSYAVEAYIVEKEGVGGARGSEPGGLLLGAGYVVHEPSLGTPDLLQVIAWHIDLRESPLSAKASLSVPHVVSVGSRVDDLEGVIRDALP